MTTDELKALLDKARETFCLASPGSDEEFAAYLCGFDAASQIALSHCDALREQMAGARVKFDWTIDRVNGHPSEAKTVWRCRVGGAVIGVDDSCMRGCKPPRPEPEPEPEPEDPGGHWATRDNEPDSRTDPEGHRDWQRDRDAQREEGAW